MLYKVSFNKINDFISSLRFIWFYETKFYVIIYFFDLLTVDFKKKGIHSYKKTGKIILDKFLYIYFFFEKNKLHIVFLFLIIFTDIKWKLFACFFFKNHCHFSFRFIYCIKCVLLEKYLAVYYYFSWNVFNFEKCLSFVDVMCCFNIKAKKTKKIKIQNENR